MDYLLILLIVIILYLLIGWIFIVKRGSFRKDNWSYNTTKLKLSIIIIFTIIFWPIVAGTETIGRK